jgi:hypothetical protein
VDRELNELYNTMKSIPGYTRGAIKRGRRTASLKRYGLTKSTYDAMFVAQNGVCKICNCPEIRPNWSLPVDHDHNTGKVRGLLCANCNAAIGLMKDSPDRLRSAAQYLDEQ